MYNNYWLFFVPEMMVIYLCHPGVTIINTESSYILLFGILHIGIHIFGILHIPKLLLFLASTHMTVRWIAKPTKAILEIF